MPAEATEDFMSAELNRHSGSPDQSGTPPSAAVFRTPARSGAARADGSRNTAEQGASPSNTAPDKCNSSFFQPLRWGIDSLYLSYPGQIAESTAYDLRELKALAQAKGHLAAQAQYRLGEHCFEVKAKGSGLFPFALEDDAFQIRLAGHKAKSLPMAYVKIASRYLSHKTPTEAEHHLRSLLAPLGELEAPKVSRVDLFVDFASTFDMESVGREAWVTKASAISQYAQDQVFTGWFVGAGGVLLARLYNKRMEIERSGKTYLEPLWREAGWDGVMPVWRLEFEFKREVLDQLGLSGLPSVMGNLNGLWSYATTDWLKLTSPSDTDQTRSRWPIHPLWGYLSSVDWESPGGPLLREYAPSRAPRKEGIGRRALSALASLAAIAGAEDFEQALGLVGDVAFQALADQAYLIGIPEHQHFREKIAVLKRKYNTGMNAVEAEEEAEDPVEREYRRQTQGN